MKDPERGASKRFDRTIWTERLVPVVLGILLFVLVAIFVLVGLSALGMI